MKKELKCKVCGSPYVVNRTHKLCHIHNQERLHGEDWKKRLKRRIKPISEKKKKVLDKKNKVYEEMDSKWNGRCTGCKEAIPCSHSHIIPVSEAPELECEEENITHHCFDCHSKWETHNIEVMVGLYDFRENMAYIKRVRPLYYNRLMNK